MADVELNSARTLAREARERAHEAAMIAQLSSFHPPGWTEMESVVLGVSRLADALCSLADEVERLRAERAELRCPVCGTFAYEDDEDDEDDASGASTPSDPERPTTVRHETPSDYAPTYYYEVDDEGQFVRLVRVRALPPEFDTDNEPDMEILPGHEPFLREHLAKRAARAAAPNEPQ